MLSPSFLAELLSQREHRVDAVNVGGLVALGALIIFTGYCALLDSATFSPLQFGTGAATIIGAYGVAKGGRDALAPKQEKDNGISGQPPK